MITKTYITSRVEKTYLALIVLSILLGVALFVVPFRDVYALPVGDTFTVTNSFNSGAGSLRQAILDANGNGNAGEQDVIEFSIPGSLDHDIVTETAITITQPVLIDGYTQDGTEENSAQWPEPFNGTLRIEIYNDISDGGIVVNSNDVTLRGLTINTSPTAEVAVSESDNFVLEGSFLGIDVVGYGMLKNASNTGGITVSESDNVRIGGGLAAERNVIGYCQEACIEITGASDNTSANPVIQGNYLGVGIDSITPMPSSRIGGTGVVINRYVENAQIGGDSGTNGNTIQHNTHGAIWATDVSNISVQGNRILDNSNFGSDGAGLSGGGGIRFAGVTDSIIGGTGSARNIIAGNDSGSIFLLDSADTTVASSTITIQNNYIGTIHDGTTSYPNTISGVHAVGNTNEVLIQDNIIRNAFNNYTDDAEDGVTVLDNAQNIAIIGNSIYNNQNMGIDIEGDNLIETNDNGDTDAGPNGLLNYPTYYDTTESGGNTTIDYTYNGGVGEYLIEFFSNTVQDDSGQGGEGETLIGSEEITYSGPGLEAFSITVPGTGHSNLSVTATEIDNGNTFGYGATSEFGGEGDPPPPVTDIVAEKRLLNPEDLALGGVLEYEITIRNDGPDSVDIGSYDASSPGANQLFIDIMPPQITYSGVSGDNISCTSFGAGSASMFGPALADHSDHELVFCGWTGGSNILAAGDSVTAVVSATIVDDSNLDFRNYVAGFLNEYDPDYVTAVAVNTSGNDILTEYEELAGNSYNNVYWVDTTVVDISISKVLTNTQDVAPGAILNYDVTFSNNGPDPADLTYFDGGGVNPTLTSLFLDVMPPNLTYTGSSNPDVNCIVFGPASIAPFFYTHGDYNLIGCTYTGAETELLAGESVATTISAEVTGSVDESFTNYVATGMHPDDPDYLYLYYKYNVAAQNALTGRGTGDLIDILGNTNRNFSFAAFEVEEPEQPGGGGNNPGSGSSNGGIGSDGDGLVDTGQAIWTTLILGIIIVLSSATLVQRSRISYKS